jgi:hypothetical protein
MAGEGTKIADVIVPEVINKYVIEKTAEKSRLRTAGIIGNVPGVTVPNGGVLVNMPYWNDLGNGDEVLSDSNPLVPAKIVAGQDIAAVLARGKSWKANDLATVFSGSDVMGAIVSLVADFWARQEQITLISILKGVFASAGMSSNMLDISAAAGALASITRNSLIDAISLLGDSGRDLTGIVCHSAVMYDLAKKEILDSRVNVGDTNTASEFQNFLGRSVIDDDGCPVETVGSDKVYTTYIFGTGAIGSAIGAPPVPTETERQALSGNDILVNRRHFILHPRGVKWTNVDLTAGESTPGNAALAKGANWQRVYEPKNVRIVAFKHKIG